MEEGMKYFKYIFVALFMFMELLDVNAQVSGDTFGSNLILDSANDIAIDSDGNIYIADATDDSIVKLDSDGNFIRKWGIAGPNEGELFNPYTVAYDPANNYIVVGEFSNSRISEFDTAGTFQAMYGWGVSDGSSAYQACTSGCESGISGSGNGQFENIRTVRFDASDNMYVSDENGIQIFDVLRGYSSEFGGVHGFAAGFDFDASGNLYVAYPGSDFIIKYNSSGDSVATFGSGEGSGAGELDQPYGVSVIGSLVYVYENLNRRISIFDLSGTFLRAYGDFIFDATDEPEICINSCSQGFITGFGTFAQLKNNSNSLYVADRNADNVKEVLVDHATMTIDGNSGWRMLAGPHDNMPVSYLAGETAVQGVTDSEDENIYVSYDGSSWSAPSALSDEIDSGEGFILYFFDNTVNGSEELPINFTAETSSQTNDVTVNLHTSGNKWNLVGNPFQEQFNMSGITVNGGSLSSSVGQIYNDATDSYVTTTTTSGKVAAWQGFFLQNDDATSVTLDASSTTNGATFYKGRSNESAYIGFELSFMDEDDQLEIKDQATVLYFNDEAINEWDTFDAEKLLPLTSNYALLAIEGEREGDFLVKAQDSRSLTSENEESYYLEFSSVGYSGNFEITWPMWESIPEEWSIILNDLRTGEQVDVRTVDGYQFTADGSQPKTSTVLLPPQINSKLNNGIKEIRFRVDITKGASVSNETEVPIAFSLNQNYPNPFNPSTTIDYSIANSGIVDLSIYNLLGQKVATLVNEFRTSGDYSINWKATNISSGVYIYRLTSNGVTLTQKMTLIK